MSYQTDANKASGPTGAETVDVAADVLATAPSKLSIELPSGTSIEAHRTYLDKRGDSALQWTGVTPDGLQVDLTLEGDRVAGTVNSSEGTFHLRPAAEGRHLFSRADTTKSQRATCTTHARGGRSLASGLLPAAPQTDKQLKDPVDQIRVLVLYTAKARQAAGGQAGIDAMAQSVIDTSNTAFRNSRMPARMQLAQAAQVPFAETTLLEDALVWMPGSAQVRQLRDAAQADMVGMLVSGGLDACGVAYTIPTGNIASFSEQMFQVTALECPAGLVFIHEMGHLLGMEHDPDNGSPPAFASYPWSYGHTVEGKVTTVMSYGTECQGNCPWLPYFSSPIIRVQGSPTGIAGERDNRRTGIAIAPIVANFRRSGNGGSRPSAPSGLQVTAASAFSVGLTWTDGSDNEQRFEVERNATGTFEVIATLPADTIAWTDTTVAADSTYSYRVRATNDAGGSEYSNAVTVDTPAANTDLCTPSDTVACVLDGRFELRVTWSDFEGGQGVGRTVAEDASQSALFWFFGADNWEMLVKMVDGCSLNQRFWVFSAATTNVAYTLQIRDTTSGETRTYSNPLGTAAAAVTDTDAFGACP